MDINAAEIEYLLDAVPDVLFFVKDRERRYTHANITIVHRLGLNARDDVIGKRVEDVYPGGLSAAYARQDALVLAGQTIENLLELQLFPNREPGWCLTCKRPLLDNGRVVGLTGISRDLDLGQSGSRGSIYERISLVLTYLNRHYAENVRMQTLTELTGFSLSKLERTFRRIFQMTPLQVLTKLRVQMAMHHLQGADTIASVSQACGFTDHSAFTRQFRTAVGMSPREYRLLLRGTGARSGSGDSRHHRPLKAQGDRPASGPRVPAPPPRLIESRQPRRPGRNGA